MVAKIYIVQNEDIPSSEMSSDTKIPGVGVVVLEVKLPNDGILGEGAMSGDSPELLVTLFAVWVRRLIVA